MLTTFSITGFLVLMGAIALMVLLIKRINSKFLKHPFMKITLTVAAVAFIFYSYLSINKPLESNSRTFNGESPTIMVATIENEGFAGFTIRDVTVNGGVIPKEVRLVTSTTNIIPSVADWEDRPKVTQGIQFQDIQAHNIPPTSDDSGKYYGIGIENDQPIKTIDITYTYFGFPFEKVIEHN
ncbi:hypothetical protein [Halobacillus salinus]|uniref:hypothetical protein n=1 Tax=Halobacillus salinus TaxID=192814 RepID=UPI0009A77522|nr:hypothetical protein [Halobacillus salinus]